MSASRAAIPFAGLPLGKSRYICAFSITDDKEYRVLLPLIEEGFERVAKAIHVIRPDQRSDHVRWLADDGFDSSGSQRTGQLTIRSSAETYIRDGAFDKEQFESPVNKVCAHHHDAVICVYDLAKCGGSIVVDMVRTHLLVISPGILRQNLFVPPATSVRVARAPSFARDGLRKATS